MRKIFLFVAILPCLLCHAQPASGKAIPIDTLRAFIIEAESLTGRETNLPPARIEEDNTKMIRAISEKQKKRRSQEKQAAMLRILLGGAFFIILMIGLMRTKKN